MSLPDALIVPINLQACACGALQPAAARVNYGQLPSMGGGFGQLPPIAASVDTSQATGSNVTGVQLHWALPGAIVSHGDWTEFMAPVNADNPPPVSLLPAPDQWLVVRTVIDAQENVSISTWVVDSGVINGQPLPGGSPPPMATMPTDLPTLQGNNAATSQTLGQTTGGPVWKAPNPASCLTPLTAAGRGQANFASFLPDCINVFGMCDPVPPQIDGTASYLVVGWYRDPASDPLAVRPRTAKELRDRLNWEVAGAQPADVMPSQTIFTGFVSSVEWNTPPAQPDLGVKMAFGVNPASALSALLAAADEPNVSGFARALTALIYGRLDLAEQADATTLIDNLLHRTGFFAVQAPSLSAVDIKGTKPGGAANPNLPSSISQAMLAANAAELAAHRLSRVGPALVNQLFWDWQNYITALYNGSTLSSLSPLMGALAPGAWSENAAALSSTQVIGNVAAALANLQQSAAVLTDTLKQACAGVGPTADSTTPVEYHVTPRDVPAYHAPLDPAFAISGTALAGTDRIGGSTPGGPRPLKVRLSSGIIGSLAITAGTAGATQDCSISGGGITFSPTPPALPNLEVAQALYAESCLIDPYYAGLLAKAVSADGVTAAGLAPLLSALLTQYKTPAGLGLSDQTGATVAPPPAPGLTCWTQNPWLPIFLRWSAALEPLGTSATQPPPSNTVTEAFSLGSTDTDLIPDSTPSPAPANIALTGIGTLSTSVSDRMAKVLKDATKNEVVDTVTAANLHTIGAALSATPIHTGHLEGFYHQALQLARQPQLPPVDLINAPGVQGANPTLLAFTQAIAQAVAGDTTLGLPATSMPPLTPLVSGGVVSTLTLVDCFGQTYMMKPSGAATTDDVFTPPSTYTSACQFYLPPRLACPSRLLTRWVAPVPGTDSLDHPTQPAVNPIRGWLLPAPANQAFLLYAADGSPLAEMTGGSSFYYTPTPGSPLTSSGSDPAAFAAALTAADVDPVMVAFVTQLANLGATSLAAFVETLDAMATDSSPTGALLNPAISALIGRPLAVVQAAACFELDGPPPADQSTNGLNAYVTTMQGIVNQPDAIPTRDPAGLLNLEFPLLVGDDGQDNDGLYAYTANGAGPIYVASTEALPAGCAAASPAPISLAAANAAQPTLLTMLVDPTAPVHLAMGILPVASLAVPPAFYQDALSKLTATISTGPLLTGLPLVASLATVVPGVGQGDWTWTQRQIVGQTTSWGPSLPLKPLDTSSQVPNGTPGLVEGWLSLNVSTVASKGARS